MPSNVVHIGGDAGPLYGEPGPLDSENLKALIQQSQRFQTDRRKKAQGLRQRILKSQHRADIADYLRTLYAPEFTCRVVPHTTVVCNPYADICGEVCQVYRGGAVRRIDGISEDQQEAFDRVVAETSISALAQGWAETAYGVGPQWIIPSVRRGRMRLHAPTPSCVDIVLDNEDPTGDPVALSYPTGRGQVAVLDGETLRHFEVGDRTREIEELRVEHRVGDLPAAALRFTPPTEASDWWDREVHQRLEDGALAVGHISAKLSHLRKAQQGKLLVLLGNVDGLAKGQPIGDPVTPVALREDGERPDDPRRTTIEALDFDTDPRNHLTHLRAITEWMAESTGVPVSVDVSGSERWDYTWDDDRLGEMRSQLAFWATRFEVQLWTFVVAVARAQRHPLALQLPTPEQVAAGFHLVLPPLHRKFSDPQKEREHWDWLISRGLASVRDVARRYLGHRPDKALDAQIQKNLDINTRWYAQLASRNLPADARDGKILTAAQAQGALGGRPASGGGASEPDGADGERGDPDGPS